LAAIGSAFSAVSIAVLMSASFGFPLHEEKLMAETVRATIKTKLNSFFIVYYFMGK
jgi:hypothetical protein